MAKNVEIKAKLSNFINTINILDKIADSDPLEIIQNDTFFNCQNGRLKLRVKNNSDGELIYYNRPNQAGPKISEYTLVPIKNFDLLKKTLSTSLGVRGTINKVRNLYMIGQTRVHLDEVENLGSYIELEVVLHDNQNTSDGKKVAKEIMNQLNISREQLVDSAYIDILDS